MKPASIKPITPSNTAFGKMLQEIEDDLSRISKRSYEIFAGNGFAEGCDVENWLRAERELFDIPSTELAENDAEFRATVAVQGFTSKQLTVAVTADSLTIRGNIGGSKECGSGELPAKSVSSQKETFRYFHLDPPVDPDRVTASFDDGVLTVVLPKAAAAKAEPKAQMAASAP